MNGQKGFTLLEVIIVIAISAMLSVVALGYTAVSRNQVALSIEATRIAESILHAKDLAIATYNNSSSTCGYGVAIDIANNKYSLFAYNPSAAKYGRVPPPCPSLASTTAGGFSSSTEMGVYSQLAWQTPVANGVRLLSNGAGKDLAVVLFYPPAPATLLSSDGESFLAGATLSTLEVSLRTVDGSASTTISVNPAGQISF